MFLENTWRYVKGYITIKVEGYFIERFLNLCMNREIELWNIKKINNVELIGNVKIKDYDKVMEIANITRCRINKNKSVGIPDILVRYKKRKIFAAIALIMIVCIYLHSIRIWQIDIVGDFNIPIEELWNELELEGVKIGMKKSDLDYDKIKNNIYVRRNDVAWMGFDIKGTKVFVEFVQRRNIVEDELKDKPCNVVADKEGVISKILVKSGQKQVEVGDTVSKGDILISGVVSDKQSNTRLVHSDGEVVVKTWYTSKVTVPYEKDVLSKTGKKDIKYKFEIGNYKINLINTSTKYEKYDTITMSNKLKLFNKFELPIKLTELIYEELEVNTVKYTKSQAENIAKNEASLELQELISNPNIEVLNNNYKTQENEDSISVEITIECLESIGVKEKILN